MVLYQMSTKTYKACYAAQCSQSDSLNTSLFNHLEEMAKLDFTNKVQKIEELVAEAVGTSEDIVDSIEEIISEKGNSYCATYESALVFEIDSFNKDNTDELVFRLWQELDDNASKCQFNIVKFTEHLTDSSSQTYGAFYGNSTANTAISPEEKTNYLASFYIRLCNEFSNKCFKITSLLIPSLPTGSYFSHDVQRNIPTHTARFYERVIRHLEGRFTSLSHQQLLMAVTRQVSKSCVDVVKQIGWDNINDCKGYRTFSKALLFSNNCEPGSTEILERVTDSVVKVTCGAKSGTGILIRTQYGFICVTCNHIVCNFPNDGIEGSLSFAHKRIFSMIPLTHITASCEDGEILDASEEVVILKPVFEGKIDLDFRRFISLEELKEMAASGFMDNCICGGFPESFSKMTWSDPFTISIRSILGYLQTCVPESENAVTQNGFSGGVIVNPQVPNILGIHEGENKKTQGRIIPIGTIIKKIEEVFQ